MNRHAGARALCLFALIVLGLVPTVLAQDSPVPAAVVDAGDVQAMAVSGDGRSLFVTNARTQILQVYSLSLENLLEEVAAVPLDAEPSALTAARDYALVTVDFGSGSDALESIGPDPFDVSSYAVLNIVDIEDNARFINIAPDFRWALLIGESWYSLVQIVSATDMIAYPLGTRAEPQSGAIGSNVALIAQDSPAQVVQYLLRRNQAPRSARTLDLRDEPGTLILNERLSLGAVISGTHEIVLFDTATMQQQGTLTVEGDQPIQMQFSAREEGEWLIVASENSRDLRIYDATNPNTMGEIGSLTLDIAASQMLIHDELLIVSDGQQIQAYTGF